MQLLAKALRIDSESVSSGAVDFITPEMIFFAIGKGAVNALRRGYLFGEIFSIIL
jgi:hypothetical protein